MRVIILIIKRDVYRMLKQRSRFASTLFRPLLWLFVIGAGIKSFSPALEGHSYQTFMIPGLFAMMLLFSGILSAFSFIKEKNSGLLRLLLISPISRTEIIITKIISASIVSTVYLAIFSGICLILKLIPPVSSYYVFFAYSLFLALLWSSLGILIAILARDLENFGVLINLIVFPLFFLSNALYPIETLPPVLYVITILNPFTYSVDIFYHILGLAVFAKYSYWLDILVLTGFFITVFTLTNLKFKKYSFNNL